MNEFSCACDLIGWKRERLCLGWFGMGGCRARMMLSGTDETGGGGGGNGDVRGALEGGGAVGEKSEGMWRALESEKKVVEADGAVRGEAVAHGDEVDGA